MTLGPCSKCTGYGPIVSQTPALCETCDRREYGMTMLIRVGRPGPSHVMLTVFAGVKGQRANTGQLIVRVGEFDAFLDMLTVSDFVEVERTP